MLERNIEYTWPHEDLDMPGFAGHGEKSEDAFRNYDDRDDQVRLTYHDINTQQTVDFVREQHKKWLGLNHARLTMLEVLDMLATFVDDSDPDTRAAQQYHAFQTAEMCKELFPEPEMEYMQVVGLIHDAGKVIGLWGQPQWATVGDTFPVGCAMAPEHVYSSFYSDNKDSPDPRYNSKYGLYAPHCGLDNVLMSFGHDEYLYQVLVRNKCALPAQGLYIIRYHSFYAHHQKHAYDHLCNEEDLALRDSLVRFQRCDLYSKSAELPDVHALREHYGRLLDKYCPGVLCW